MERPDSAATLPRRRVQRSVDIVVAGTALALLSPLMAVVALLIRLTSRGPVIFTQRRVGLNRRMFDLYKFRTMRTGCSDSAHRDLIVRELQGLDTSHGGSCKLAEDDRVTRIGALLRKTSLDELPQLVNVLRGDMTLVGPRPCLEWEAELFPQEYEARFEVTPGLTGLWQVSGRSMLGTLDMLRIDTDYAQRRSAALDLKILAQTVPVLLRGDGAR